MNTCTSRGRMQSYLDMRASLGSNIQHQTWSSGLQRDVLDLNCPKQRAGPPSSQRKTCSRREGPKHTGSDSMYLMYFVHRHASFIS
ncbi:hypothetical protein VZT92_018083 [Zoarces viviparus]|uniref:Uncharacterized protein n=1 Tax=Zoarces viviparus TaxID=48416 RepID=A0AAW1EPV8_ZOAVI